MTVFKQRKPSSPDPVPTTSDTTIHQALVKSKKQHLSSTSEVESGNQHKRRVITVNSDDDDGDESLEKLWVQMGNTRMTEQHKDELLTGKWLNDCHIQASQQLMKLDQDLLSVGGLKDPIFGQTLCFDVTNTHAEMVQILHSDGTVRVYDRIYYG